MDYLLKIYLREIKSVEWIGLLEANGKFGESFHIVNFRLLVGEGQRRSRSIKIYLMLINQSIQRYCGSFK
jgi:hypothetical protein